MMVVYASSVSAECCYCEAHSAASAVRVNVPIDTVAAIRGNFEHDDRFSEAEKSALRFAHDAAKIRNAVTANHFVELRQHFDDEQIVEMLAVVSIMEWLNRWNATMATQLEKEPLTLATENLSASGWEAGKHAAEA